MRIAIVGAGRKGLSAAQLLGADPRHATSVLETQARFDDAGVSLFGLVRLGVTLRHTAQVERLAVDATSVHLWINGVAERFDLALVATSPAEARALLLRSGVSRSMPLGGRVYFADDPEDTARAALARIAADHADVRAPQQAPADTLRSPVRLAGGTAIDYVDLSDHAWPLDEPAVYVANRRWLLDVVPAAFVVDGRLSQGREAAVAALAVNAPIVPIAGGPRDRGSTVRVVVGELFYPETSAIDELAEDMRLVVRHLERFADEPAAIG